VYIASILRAIGRRCTTSQKTVFFIFTAERN
jgi:hypothetical protein